MFHPLPRLRLLSRLLRLALAASPFGLSAMAAADHPAELPLWPAGIPGALPPDRITDRENAVPGLTPYLLPAGGGPSGAAHPVVVVCPGGGYTHLAMAKEGYDVARWLNTLGISAVVLRYRLRDYGQPAPLRDVLQAIRTVRAKAAEWGVDPRRTGVMGFSAGGHLASCAGTLYAAPEGRTGGAYDAISARPDFLVLVYPVISMREPWVHRGSRDSLLGPQPSPARVAEYSTDTRVTKDTPPTFLVHSSEDPVVPVENSVLFYSALRRAGVPAEMHLFRSGPHGFGLLPGYGPISDWPRLCADWLRAGGWTGP